MQQQQTMSQTMASSNEANASVQQQQQRRRCVRWGGSTSHNNNNNNNNNSSNDDRVGGGGECEAWGRTRSPPRGARAQCMRVESLLQPRDDNEYNDNNSNNDDDDDGNGNTHATVAAVAVSSTPPLWLAPCAQPSWQHRTTSAIITTAAAAAETPLAMCCDDVGSGSRDAACCTRAAYTVDADNNNNNNAAPLLLLLQQQQQQQQQQQRPTPQRRVSRSLASIRHVAVATARALVSGNNSNSAAARAGGAGGATRAHASSAAAGPEVAAGLSSRDAACLQQRGCSRASAAAAAAAAAATGVQLHNSSEVRRGDDNLRAYYRAAGDEDADDDDTTPQRHVCRHRRCRDSDDSDSDEDSTDGRVFQRSTTSTQLTSEYSMHRKTMSDVSTSQGGGTGSSSSSSSSASLSRSLRGRVCLRVSASTALAVYLCLCLIVVFLLAFLPFHISYSHVISGLIRSSLSNAISFASFTTTNRFMSFMMLVRSLTAHTLLCDELADADVCAEYNATRAALAMAFAMVRFQPTVKRWSMYRGNDDDVNSNSNSNISNSSNNSSIVTSSDDLRTGLFADVQFAGQDVLVAANNTRAVTTPRVRLDMLTLLAMSEGSSSSSSSSHHEHGTGPAVPLPGESQFDILVDPARPWMRDVYLAQLHNGTGAFHDAWVPGPQAMSRGYSQLYVVPFASRNTTGFCLTVPNLVSMFEGIRPLVPLLREHGRMIIVDVANNVSVYQSWQNSSLDATTTTSAATATSLASSSSPSSALPRAAAVTADTVANTDTNKDNGEAADRLEPPLTLSMSMTAVVRPVPYDQLDDAMVRAAMAEVQRRGGVQALMQAHGPMRMRYGRSNILLNVTSSMTAMNTLPFATLIFLLESDFLDTLRHTTTIVLCVCAVVAVVMTVCAFVTAHYAMRALRRLVPDIQRLSALEIPSHTTATTTAAATMTTTDTPAATRAHADEADNHHQQHLGSGVSARTLRVADEDATAATAPTTAGSGARLLTRAATTRRGCRRVAAAVCRRVRVWVRGAVCWLQQRGSRAWHWLATWQMSYTELWRVARACDELRASLRVMKSLMPQAVMTTSASATTAAAAAVAVLDNTTTTTALAPPVSDVVSELEDTMHVADVVVALHANVNDCNRTRGHDACGDTARAIELQRNRRVNTLILMDKPYVFARRAFTLVYIVGHGVPMHLMQAMLGALMECVLLYNGCVEQLGHSHALISFGAHASLPMHAAKGCNFALDMYRQHCTHAPGYPVVFVVDTNEYAVGTCGTHKNSARVVLGTNYLVDTARVLYNIHCSIAATPAATSHLPDYQSVPIECIRVDSVNVPLVLCELRPVTPQSDVAQMTADAVHFRAGFFCMRLGMYGHALSHYRAIQCRSDRQAQRLLDVCQQRCAALDTSPYMGLSTNTYYFRPWRRSSVDGGNNNNNNGSSATRAVVSNATRQCGDDDNARNEANAMHSDKAHASTASQQQQQQHRVDDNDNGDAMQQQQHRRHHHHHRHRRRGPRVGTASTLDTSAAASSQTLLLHQQQQSLWTLPRPTADVVVSPRQEGQQRRSSSSSNNDDDDDSDDSDDHSSSSSSGSSSASSKDDHDSPRLNAQTRGSDDGGGGDDGGRGGGNNSSSDNNNNNTSATAAAAANERYNASTATALFDVIYMPSSSREELTDVVDTTSGAPTATVPLTFRDVDGCVWYRSLRPIGEGAFSTVYLGMSEKGLQVAIKCIARCRRDAQEQSIADELHIAARLRHPNVVSYISCSVTLTHFAIFMELVPGGSLHAVQKQFGALTEAVVRRFIMDILNGLIYLHKNGVVHCDIKPHNMLLDVNGVCKLSDFGSTIMGDSLKGNNNNNNNRQDGDGTVCDVDEPPRVRGTVLYMAPEVAVGGPCTTQSDIFSFGASLLELLLGRVPWCWTASAPPGSNAASLQRLLRHEMMFVSSLARGEVELRVPDTLGYEAQNVARACCRLVPAERPSAQELMRFPFFT